MTYHRSSRVVTPSQAVGSAGKNSLRLNSSSPDLLVANSSALHCSAASGTARQNSGSSDKGRPKRPSYAAWATAGAHAAKTRNRRCRATERKPTVRGEAEDPTSSAAIRALGESRVPSPVGAGGRRYQIIRCARRRSPLKVGSQPLLPRGLTEGRWRLTAATELRGRCEVVG